MKMYKTQNATRLFAWVFTTCFLLVLSACGSNGDNSATSETTLSIPSFIPMQRLVAPEANLVAWVTIDNGSRISMTIDSQAGTASASIPNQSLTTHTVLVEFEFTDGVDTVILATASSSVDLSSGDTTLTLTDAEYVVNLDDDNDGITNLEEVANGTDPLVPDPTSFLLQ